MLLILAAVGRLRDGPERALIDDYLARARALGRGLGFGDVEEIEIHIRPADREREADALLKRLPPQAFMIGLDEKGEDLPSLAWAQMLAPDRDAPAIAIILGGADGHGAALRARFDRLIAFGTATWPHRLARAMAAEQIYRALSIRAHAPYHREG